MICNWSLKHRKFKSVPYPIAAKSCVSGVKSSIRNSQIPYLKANSIFKESLDLTPLALLYMSAWEFIGGNKSQNRMCWLN